MRRSMGGQTESRLTRAIAVRTAAGAVIVGLVMVLASCSNATGKAADLIGQNKALDARYMDALLHNDINALMSTYLNSPDTFEIDSDGTLLKGYDAIKSYYQKLLADMQFEEGKLLEQDYQVYAGSVIGHGKYWARVKSKQDGKEMELTGRYLDVRTSYDGKWYYVSNMQVGLTPDSSAVPKQ